jgi:hypothetical protein
MPLLQSLRLMRFGAVEKYVVARWFWRVFCGGREVPLLRGVRLTNFLRGRGVRLLRGVRLTSFLRGLEVRLLRGFAF